MVFQNVVFDSIDEKEIQFLIQNEVREGKTIDYKEGLSIGPDSTKIEFLADISSFANGSGGYLIYGLSEAEGIPTKIIGLDINPDAEITRLENIIREGIEPRIPGIRIKAIKTSNARYIIVVFIPRSWALPHRVRFKDHAKFYSRNSAGKYPLDVPELRALFSLSETSIERIRNFRLERISNIIAEETSVKLESGAKLAAHLVPFSAFDPSKTFYLPSLMKFQNLSPIYASGWSKRYNFDGLLIYQTLNTERRISDSYVQIFRNGIIEAVNTSIFNQENKSIPSLVFEEEILRSFPQFISAQRTLGVDPPIFCMTSIIGGKGFNWATPSPRFYKSHTYLIEKDTILLPDVITENYESNPAETFRPIFDSLWNTAGFEKSAYYDENGKWIGNTRF